MGFSVKYFWIWYLIDSHLNYLLHAVSVSGSGREKDGMKFDENDHRDRHACHRQRDVKAYT